MAPPHHGGRVAFMQTLYFDGEAGAAGDMILGALIHIGLDPAELTTQLKPIAPAEFEIRVDDVSVCGIAAKRAVVRTGEEPGHRTPGEIGELLRQGKLSDDVRERAFRVVERLAAAEAHVHNATPETVHFHEVGMTDAIVDIVGAVWGLERLGIEAVFAAPLVLGSGRGRSAHGPIIYPAPATVEILRGLPVRIENAIGETTTPTGAAILAEVATFTDDVVISPEAIGYGAGRRDFDDRPNLLRATRGTIPGQYDSDYVWLAATDIDNTRPEVFDWLAERLRDSGALDVTLSSVAMKKGRPGVRIEVLCGAQERERVADLILTETGSLGVRWTPVSRTKLKRRVETIATPWGPIRIKVAQTARGERGIPEYDDCCRAAATSGEPLLTVIDTATQIFNARNSTDNDREG
jgi:uncharacterized protein (TIGR00299 family) protein